MKMLIFKAVLMVVIAIGFSNYMMYVMTGKTPFSKESFSLEAISNKAPSLDEINPIKSSEVYKWVDENGVTQYSSEPPPANIQSQTLNIDPNVNVVQGLKIEEEPGAEESAPQVSMPQSPIYSPENVKKLMDDARNVQKLLNDRHKAQDDLLEDN